MLAVFLILLLLSLFSSLLLSLFSSLLLSLLLSALHFRFPSWSSDFLSSLVLLLLPLSLTNEFAEVVEQDVKRIKYNVDSPDAPHASRLPNQSPLTPLSSPTQGPATASSTAVSQQIPDIYRIYEPGEAVRILREVPISLFGSLVDLWFKECQPWFPILKRSKLEQSLEQLVAPVEGIDDIVLRALIALSFSHSSAAVIYGYKGRRQVSAHLRADVLVEAMAKVSLDSLQALLIIAVLDYGNDDIPSTWSLLSVCRRLCEQLGLFRRLLTQMQENNTPGQMELPSREAFEGEELAIPLTWVLSALDSSTTLGASWRDASAALMEHISSIAYISAPDLRDSFVTHVHLAAIGLQPVHTYLYDQKNRTVTDDATIATVDEIYHNLMSYGPMNTGTYTYLPDGTIDFDCMSALTSILIDGSVITLYGRHLDLSTSTPGPGQATAIERCSQACKNMVGTVRNVSDADIELNSPSLVTQFFIAARYMLVLQQYTGQPRGPEFDVVMHAANMCGRRWPVARRLDIVLRAAIVEVDKFHLVTSQVPAVFWDLRRSAVEIDASMKDWVQNYRPCLFGEPPRV